MHACIHTYIHTYIHAYIHTYSKLVLAGCHTSSQDVRKGSLTMLENSGMLQAFLVPKFQMIYSSSYFISTSTEV